MKKIGNPAKIRQCLVEEQRDMEKLEECVEKRAGPIGCTNEENPKNLTIPVIPEMMEGGNNRQKRAIPEWDFEDAFDWAGRNTRAAQVPPLPATVCFISSNTIFTKVHSFTARGRSCSV